MGFREATPGLVLSLGATVLLAIVSFNTPLLKSLNFLTANYVSDGVEGQATFGTLGYCVQIGTAVNECIGPKVGYTFDPNAIFGITVINIPSVVTKLTYVLILHVVALGLSVASIILGLLSHIRGFALLCFPSCFAWLTSAVTLIAFVFDVAVFYIARARINSVSGGSASIGICVWLTLAAWVLTGLSGCAYTLGQCCVSRRRDEQSRYPRNGYQNDDSYGMAGSKFGPPLRDLPKKNRNEKEVSVPLTAAAFDHRDDDEPKYLEDEEQPLTSGDVSYHDSAHSPPRRQPSTIDGVGYGYGKRDQASGQPQYDQYGNIVPSANGPSRPLSPATTAGSYIGVGANRYGSGEYVPPVPAVPGQFAAPAGQGYGPSGMAAGAAQPAGSYSWGQATQYPGGPEQQYTGQHQQGPISDPYSQSRSPDNYYPPQTHAMYTNQSQYPSYNTRSPPPGGYPIASASTAIPQPQPTPAPVSPTRSSGHDHQYYGAGVYNNTGYPPVPEPQHDDVGGTYGQYASNTSAPTHSPIPVHADGSRNHPAFPLDQATSPVSPHSPTSPLGTGYQRQSYGQAYEGSVDNGQISVRPPSYTSAMPGQRRSTGYPSAAQEKQTYFR